MGLLNTRKQLFKNVPEKSQTNKKDGFQIWGFFLRNIRELFSFGVWDGIRKRGSLFLGIKKKKCIFPSKGQEAAEIQKHCLSATSVCGHRACVAHSVRVLRGNTLNLVLSDLAQGMTLLSGKKCFPGGSDRPLPLAVSTMGTPGPDLRLCVVSVFHCRECGEQSRAKQQTGREAEPQAGCWEPRTLGDRPQDNCNC